jgi:hypothetical protein
MNQPIIFLRETLRMQQEQRDVANRRLKDKYEPYPGLLRKVVDGLDSSIAELIEAVAILEREYQVDEPGAVVPEFLRALYHYAGDGSTMLSLQYEDNPGEWTEPVMLTREIADRVKTNRAVERIRLVMSSALNKEVEFIPA